MAARCSIAALIGFVVTAPIAAPGALAAPPAFKGISGDGTVVIFEAEETLLAGDTDSRRDVYLRSFEDDVVEGGAYVTRQVSTGPAGGNDSYNAFFERASEDGTRVFFTSEERLVAEDTDLALDVYVRDVVTGVTTLVSRGASSCAPACGNGKDLPSAGFDRGAADGSDAYLVTVERLDPAADSDEAVDVYRRDLVAETTTLVSAGAECAPICGNGAATATPRDVSSDGSTAFFVTDERLTGADTDSAIDIYARDVAGGGGTTLVSRGDPLCACGNSGAAPVYKDSSADGSRAFFTTDEPLVEADADDVTDVYARDLPSGPTSLVSSGSAEELTASFEDASSDGTQAFFSTTESLVEEDTNDANDIYSWSGGAPVLITSGICPPEGDCGSTFNAATADGATVFFTTTELLDPGDEDDQSDIYGQEVGGGAPTLVSRGVPACVPECGNGTAPAIFGEVAASGATVVFTSIEPLVPLDIDEEADVYVRDLVAGTTTLASPPPGLCSGGECPATFLRVSGDSVHVFLQTMEWLVPEDSDAEPDIYERDLNDATTRLVSTGNSPDLDLGPPPPNLEGTDPPSPSASVEPAVLGEAEAEALIKLYDTPDCSGEPAATGTAEQLTSPGIAATVGVDETTNFRATAEAEGFASLCSAPISYRHESAPPPPGGGGGGSPAGTAPPLKTHSGGIPYVTPVTRITFGPAFKTRARRPVFRFTDSTGQPDTRFICKLDKGRWKSCSSPHKLKGLSRGKHVFSVKAVNAVGAWEPRPSKRVFKLVRSR